MGAFHQYDPGKVILSVGTLPSPISGYQEGTFIEVSRDANAFEKAVGADGEVTRIRNRNRAGSIKITLQQGSNANALLSALADTDELTGLGVIPLTLMDMSGAAPKSVAATPYAWIRKKPNMTFSGNKEEAREWIFDCGTLEHFIGGN